MLSCTRSFELAEKKPRVVPKNMDDSARWGDEGLARKV